MTYDGGNDPGRNRHIIKLYLGTDTTAPMGQTDIAAHMTEATGEEWTRQRVENIIAKWRKAGRPVPFGRGWAKEPAEPVGGTFEEYGG